MAWRYSTHRKLYWSWYSNFQWYCLFYPQTFGCSNRYWYFWYSYTVRRCIIDLLLDEVTHDIVWNNGPLTREFTTQPYTQTVGQRLKIRLLTFMGEYFWDTSYGVPYWQRLLGIKQTSKSAIDLIFSQKILEEPGVKEIVTFNSTFSNRIYSLTFSVRVVDGSVTDTISINPTN